MSFNLQSSGGGVSNIVAGNWDANTNSPDLTALSPTPPDGTSYYVAVAGTQDLGNGSTVFDVGDFAVYVNATYGWVKRDATPKASETTNDSTVTGATVKDALETNASAAATALAAIPAKATEGEATTGTEDTKYTTPLKVFQAIYAYLPAGPLAGDWFEVKDYAKNFGTTKCVLSPNATDKVEGVAADYDLNANTTKLHFHFDNTKGWIA